MGYTHYWYRPETLDPERFITWTQDVQVVLQHLPAHSASAGGYHIDDPLEIAGWDGTGEPEFTKRLVSFNGRGPELDHETFRIEQRYHPFGNWDVRKEDGTYFECCKTARKPYDLLVTACLIRFKHHFPEVRVSSDGSPKDWIEGLKLCTTLFGSAQLPLAEEEEEESNA